MAYGTLFSGDTLASTQQTIAEYGEDRAWQDIQAALAAHNRITDQMRGQLVELTQDRQRRYGSQDQMNMQKVDEFGRAYAQKISAGATVGFPLEGFEIAVQYTRLYLMNATGPEVAAQIDAIADADVQNLQREYKIALFTPTNSTFIDRRVDGVTLAVKRLLNADGASIPLGPNGETFNGATHTHYLARVAALAASDISGVVNTVIEHHAVGQARLYINRAEEAAVRGFTANFLGYLPVSVVGANNANQATGRLDVQNPNDREIGLWDQTAVVSVKPWIPAGYMFAWVEGAPPPLAHRVRNAAMGALGPVYDDELHPLRARGWAREFGIGAWTRTNGAVLYVGGTTYTVPVIS